MRKEEKRPEDEVQAAIMAAKALTDKYEVKACEWKPSSFLQVDEQSLEVVYQEEWPEQPLYEM